MAVFRSNLLLLSHLEDLDMSGPRHLKIIAILDVTWSIKYARDI